MMRRLAGIILIAAAVVGGGWMALHRQGARNGAKSYENLPRGLVERGKFTVTLAEVGILSAERRELIRPPFSGRLRKLVEDGSFVEKGQPLAWMDVDEVIEELEEEIDDLREIKADLERNIETIKMGLESDFLDLQTAAAELEFNQLQLVDLNRELMTLESLEDVELVSTRQVDSARIGVASSELGVVQSDLGYRQEYAGRESQKTVNSMELSRLKRHRDEAMGDINEEQGKLNVATIVAPISGIFLLEQRYDHHAHRFKTVSIDEKLSSRETIGSIPDLSSLVVKTQITESSITRVGKGSKALTGLDAFPDLKMEGEVIHVGLVAIPRDQSPAGQLTGAGDASGLKVFEIIVRPDSADDRLRPGMTANV
jgi:multidrug efflux pump subunit AcrA (membrane-fusion protein)